MGGPPQGAGTAFKTRMTAYLANIVLNPLAQTTDSFATDANTGDAVVVAYYLRNVLGVGIIAPILNSNNIAASKCASVLAESVITAADIATILNDTTSLSDAKAKTILESTNLTQAKINNALVHDNVTDLIAQSRLALVDPAVRTIGGYTTIGAYGIFDDFDDNLLNGRVRDAATVNAALGTNVFAQRYRPEWEQVAGTTVVSTGELRFNETSEAVRTPCSQSVGTWEVDFTCENNVNNYFMYFMYVDDTNYNALSFNSNLARLQLYCNGVTVLNSFTTIGSKRTFKVTRDGLGNFSIYAQDNLLSSINDLSCTTSNFIKLVNTGDASNHTCSYDNLKVY